MSPSITRVGVILAVHDVAALTRFYVDALGFADEAQYDDPPYAILTRDGMRLSLAQEGHPAGDLPDHVLTRTADGHRPSMMLVVETDDCEALREAALRGGAAPVSEVFRPPWGGARCFVADPEGNLIELEELA